MLFLLGNTVPCLSTEQILLISDPAQFSTFRYFHEFFGTGLRYKVEVSIKTKNYLYGEKTISL